MKPLLALVPLLLTLLTIRILRNNAYLKNVPNTGTPEAAYSTMHRFWQNYEQIFVIVFSAIPVLVSLPIYFSWSLGGHPFEDPVQIPDFWIGSESDMDSALSDKDVRKPSYGAINKPYIESVSNKEKL